MNATSPADDSPLLRRITARAVPAWRWSEWWAGCSCCSTTAAARFEQLSRPGPMNASRELRGRPSAATKIMAARHLGLGAPVDASRADRPRRLRCPLRDLHPAPAGGLHRLGGGKQAASQWSRVLARLRHRARLDAAPPERDRPHAHAARLAPHLLRRRRTAWCSCATQPADSAGGALGVERRLRPRRCPRRRAGRMGARACAMNQAGASGSIRFTRSPPGTVRSVFAAAARAMKVAAVRPRTATRPRHRGACGHRRRGCAPSRRSAARAPARCWRSRGAPARPAGSTRSRSRRRAGAGTRSGSSE